MNNAIEIRQQALNREAVIHLRNLGFILSFVRYNLEDNKYSFIYKISVEA